MRLSKAPFMGFKAQDVENKGCKKNEEPVSCGLFLRVMCVMRYMKSGLAQAIRSSEKRRSQNPPRRMPGQDLELPQ